MVAAKMQVAAPTMVTADMATWLVSNMGERRHTMNTPAVTMVAAMNEGGDGRGAFHGVGKPGVQAKLRRLAHRARNSSRQITVIVSKRWPRKPMVDPAMAARH